MVIKNVNKKVAFLFQMLFCFMFFNCTVVKANESLIYVQIHLNEKYIHYDEVISKYGEIWIGYTPSKIRYAINNNKLFVIEKAYCFYKKSNEYILLGSIDKTGVYDKNGNSLYKPILAQQLIAGISSSLIQDILGPSLIVQSEIINDVWWESEAFVILDIDTKQDTLRLMDMSMFF